MGNRLPITGRSNEQHFDCEKGAIIDIFNNENWKNNAVVEDHLTHLWMSFAKHNSSLAVENVLTKLLSRKASYFTLAALRLLKK